VSGLIVAAAWVGVIWLHKKFAPPNVLNNYCEGRPWAAYMATGCIVSLIVAGFLDSTFDWERLPFAVSLYCFGSAINLRALMDNPFFHPEIIAPPFRVRSGVYAYLDHPGYFGFLVRFLGLAYFIDTPFATAIFAAYASFLAGRALRENQILRGL